jgi:polyisoprenoid-binding protein YceI
MSSTTVNVPGLVAGTWVIDPVHSDVGFAVRHLMVSKVRGSFSKFNGKITALLTSSRWRSTRR